MDQSTTSANPYADAALVYRERGWLGVLPADLNGKPGHVPGGFTGGHDVDPNDDQVERWRQTLGDHNVALRLPDDVIGIDVDAYVDGKGNLKRGDETIAYVAEQLDAGDLPPTWSSTARGPNQPSRIWLYRVTPGQRWRGQLGTNSNVEIIQRGHRWTRVWPSKNHRLVDRSNIDSTYRWYRPDGTASAVPPRPEDLTELPESWVAVIRDDSPVSASPAGESAVRQHERDDVPSIDVDGRPIDPHEVLIAGLPIGNQNTELFRYMCSLRSRGAYRDEMIALGMVAIQAMTDEPGRDPWKPEDIHTLVDRVRGEYAPGGSVALPSGMQAFADRLRAGTITVDEPPLVDEIATDLGNSMRFARLFRNRARYAADVERWYVWDGRRWAPDRTNRVMELTKHVIDDIRTTALTLEGDDQNRWLTWARDSEMLNRRRGMIIGAQSEPGLVVLSDVFDSDSDLLVTRSGTLDLRTGLLRPADPADLCSHLAEVDWEPDAVAPRWDGHVELLTDGDEELARYLARAVGYSLTGDVGARSFFFLEGSGSNGKNAFIEPIMQLMGSYAQTASTALLTGDDQQHPTIMADLMGARLVFIDETRQGRALNVERIKALTGSKRVKARQMRKDFFEFDARFKLWIAGNGRPTVKDPSDGVWSRLHRVVCHGKVAADKRVDRFGDVLYEEEASGILNWAVRGLLDWRELKSLGVPTSVKEDVESYRDDEDYDAQFVGEWLEITDSKADWLVANDVYKVYLEWAKQSGLGPADTRKKPQLSQQLNRLKALAGGLPVKVDGRTTRVIRKLRWQEGAPVSEVLGLGYAERSGRA